MSATFRLLHAAQAALAGANGLNGDLAAGGQLASDRVRYGDWCCANAATRDGQNVAQTRSSTAELRSG